MAKLRKMLTHPGKNESGQGVLAIALILLMLGAVILTPLLVFMSTGLKAGQVYESKLQEFYAADAGVEDAIWKIKDGNLSVPVYSLDEEVNDRNVTVTINNTEPGIYLINSTATSDSGGNTTIECYVLNIAGFFGLFDSAITSNGNVTIKSGANVTGNITANGTVDNKGDVNGTVTEGAIINFPSELQLSRYYWEQVKDFPYSDGDIDVSDSSIALGAWYTEPPYTQGVFDIYNKDSETVVNATLNGIVYVTDDLSTQYDLQIGQDPHDFTLNLSNQTIFCEGGIWVGDKVKITGSGCIIAVGDVYFAPNGDVGGPGDFVFIMSVGGNVELQPSGDFYGAIVGNVTIELKSGHEGTITWIDPGDGGNFNFPTESMGVLTVLSYTIK